MSKGRIIAETQAEDDLRAVGYEVIQRGSLAVNPREKRSPGLLHHVSDIIAWGPDQAGDFGPLVSVEVKSRTGSSSMAGALSRLAASASSLGTAVNLVYADGEWLQADPGLVSLSPIEGPPPCPPGDGVVRDPSLLAQLLEARLWALADDLRATTQAPQDAALVAVLSSVSLGADGHVGGLMPGVLVPPAMFVRVWTEAASSQRGYVAEHSTPYVVSEVLTRIASVRPGERVLDPFAGFGGTLAALGMSMGDAPARVTGNELNGETHLLANQLLGLIEPGATVTHADSFSAVWGSPNVIVSAPPFGLRLLNPVEVPFGRTTDGDVATIALAAKALEPGGRAVLLTSRGWTFRSGPSERLRRWLVDNVHVSALIGIPPVLRTTGIPLLITVIDKEAPGDAVVANLADDWREQLAPGTELMTNLARRM